MSLINDALKRTKDVQQQTAVAADGPALRPVEPAQAKTGTGARMLLLTMVFAVFLGNLLLWLAFKDRGTQPTTANTAPPSPAAVTPASPVVATPPAPVEPASQAAPVAPPIEANTPPSGAEGSPDTAVAAASTVTNTAPEPEPKVVFAEPPQPTVLRLQSIIYGSRPSAMIAGKFLSVGDRIQGHQVVAIHKETVTLVGDGQTNVLSLP